MTISIGDHCTFIQDLARIYCRGRIDHEDLAQDVIERWLRALPGLPAGTNHEAWLTTVLKNLLVDRLRRHQREQPADCDLVAAIEHDPLPWWLELCARDVDRELAGLPAAQRTTFRMFAFEGLTYDEIARRQRIAKATVGTRILRARVRLRQLLQARRPGDGDGDRVRAASRCGAAAIAW